jgi:hypothetical protein
MPRLNSRGQIAAGVDGWVSLAQPDAQTLTLTPTAQYLAEGQCAQWLDDDRLIFQSKKDDRLWVYDLRTKEFSHVEGGEAGGNMLAAGGGIWAAWLAGRGLYTQAFTSTQAGLAGVGTDGRGSAAHGLIALVPDRQIGFGITLADGQGRAVLSIPGADGRSAQILGPFDLQAAPLIWLQDGHLMAHGLPQPLPHPERVAGVRACQLAGAWYLLLTLDWGVVLRRWDSTIGKIIVPTPTGFAADLCPVQGRYLRVCWSLGVGERPEEIRWTDVDPARQFTEDTGKPPESQPQPKPKPQPKPDPQPQPKPQPKPQEPAMPNVSFPKTPDDFRITEFPQLVQARRTFLNDPSWEPDPGWCVHQMGQRYGLAGISGTTAVPAAITPRPLADLIAHELNPDGSAGSGSQEPPQR